MPFLKKDAPPELIEAARQIEERADRCYEALRLLQRPSNIAIWALLVGCVRRIEEEILKYGDNSPQLPNALLNLSRSLPIAIRWAFEHAKHPSSLASKRWTPMLASEVEEAISVAHRYVNFLGTFPLWHRDWFAAELISPTLVRFVVPGSARNRQVSAYQKGFRPDQGYYKGVRPEKPKPSPLVDKLFRELFFQTCRKIGAARFEYDDPWDLWFALLSEYEARMDGIVRRAEFLSLGEFTIRDFKKFYAALMTICAAHEYLCFLWEKQNNIYPTDSAILIRSEEKWTATLSKLSGIESGKCRSILRDLTFDFSGSLDLHIHPIVPLDRSPMNLAIVPAFPLHSRADENILRVCSLLRPSEFDVTSLAKEQEMRADLNQETSLYAMQGPITLPRPTPDIDLVVTDEPSSTIVIAELKWIRKTIRSIELLSRNAEVRKGIRQLEQIRDFLTIHPDYLYSQRKIPRPLTDYKNIYYLLVPRDHWLWVEPTEDFAIVEFEAFSTALKRPEGLNFAVGDLLKYEWLPQEGRNFRVQFDISTVNGVSIENEVFYLL
jgi:hypothetical protein